MRSHHRNHNLRRLRFFGSQLGPAQDIAQPPGSLLNHLEGRVG